MPGWNGWRDDHEVRSRHGCLVAALCWGAVVAGAIVSWVFAGVVTC